MGTKIILTVLTLSIGAVFAMCLENSTVRDQNDYMEQLVIKAENDINIIKAENDKLQQLLIATRDSLTECINSYSIDSHQAAIIYDDTY